MRVNFQEVLKRIIKYLVEGLMVAIACHAIPKASLKVDEILLHCSHCCCYLFHLRHLCTFHG